MSNQFPNEVEMEWAVAAVTNGETLEVVAFSDKGRAFLLTDALQRNGVPAIAFKRP